MVQYKKKKARKRTNKEVQDILQGVDTVKFIKSPRLRQYEYIERKHNQRIPKQTVTARMEEIWKRGRTFKIWVMRLQRILRQWE